jgi:hypothetical protein
MPAMSEAFISYSRADTAFADKLTRDLEDRGIPVWIDRENIEGGAAWRASISTAIRSACAFILILSPRSTQSGQVSKELSVAETHNRLIIPVVLETCDIPPGMELQLAELQWISFAEHPYEAALERLTRVITEARSRTAGAATSAAASAAPRASAPMAQSTAPRSVTSDRASAGETQGSSRKWLLAGTAAIVIVGASFAAFRYMQEASSTASREDTARVKPAPAIDAAIPAVDSTSTDSRASVVSTVAQEAPKAAPHKPAVVARADSAPEKPAARTEPAPAQASSAVVGNSRTLLYHFPGCPNYSKIGSQVRIEFANAREAERAGYRLSDNCADPSGGRAAVAVIANSRTHDYFLPHCNGYAGTAPQYRVPFNSTADAEQAGYKRAEKCR